MFTHPTQYRARADAEILTLRHTELMTLIAISVLVALQLVFAWPSVLAMASVLVLLVTTVALRIFVRRYTYAAIAMASVFSTEQLEIKNFLTRRYYQLMEVSKAIQAAHIAILFGQVAVAALAVPTLYFVSPGLDTVSADPRAFAFWVGALALSPLVTMWACATQWSRVRALPDATENLSLENLQLGRRLYEKQRTSIKDMLQYAFN